VDVTGDRIADPWGVRTPHEPGCAWAARTDTHLGEGVTADVVDRSMTKMLSPQPLTSTGVGEE
jgi:hypothetical protein